MNPGLAENDFEIGRLAEPLRAAASAVGVWRPRRLAPGTVLFHQGDLSDVAYVQIGGLTRLAYETPAGDVWVKSFIADVGFFASGEAVGNAQPAAFSAQCLEASMVAELPLRFVAAALGADSALSAAFAAFTNWVRLRKQAREADLLCLTAEARYLNFLRDEPRLATRLLQGDIARYLGVTPIAFSRIKKRLARP